MLFRFVEPSALTTVQELDGRASAWCTATYRSRGELGTARLRTSWMRGSSSKETALTFAHTGVEVWIDHTAMTGFAARGGRLFDTHDNDGQTPWKAAHYQPLYGSVLSDSPDSLLTFEAAATIRELHHTASEADVVS